MIIKHSLAKTFLFIGMIAVTVFGGYPQSAFGFRLPRGGLAEESHRLSGNPMVRIQLSGMDRFEVRKTGDRRGAGELRYIRITLNGTIK